MLNQLISHFLSRVRGTASETKPYPVPLPASGSPVLGRALLSYIADSVVWPDDHPRMLTHSNYWKCREIARLLGRAGFEVDAINWNDDAYVPQVPYDLVVDIDVNLQRFAPLLPEKSLRILLLTGSYGPYQHQSELARVAAFEERTGKLYSPKRLVRSVELAERSLRLAHYCLLSGNGFTLSTYPDRYRGKIMLLPACASVLPRVRSTVELVPEKKEFLWFAGYGAVHKGLDLVLEVFRKRPEWVLHVVGDAKSERDFMLAYGDCLSRPNIRWHGRLIPGSPSFLDILRDTFCFISPSCSEGINTSAATCLQLGLFPVISRQNGVDLPPGCGIYLEELSPMAIEKAIRGVLALDKEETIRQIQACQEMALRVYNRQAFSEAFSDFLRRVLATKQSRDGYSI